MLHIAPLCPNALTMQVRIDADLAKIVERESKAHRRLFKRAKSASSIVNQKLRETLTETTQAFILSPEAAGVKRSKEVKIYQRLPSQ